ncbi:DNA methyltransferase [Ottowia beijingensis]|uniref:DNA methyltransferase n=1 Tax=Ottowia beijingensis TaxID=1207057 RepID=UPI0027DA7AC5|nr:DNA methyltransferase [Ottowia beijingensis]
MRCCNSSLPAGEGRVGHARPASHRPAPHPHPLPRGAREPARHRSPWPAASVVIGNPPFIGDKKMRGELGDAYTETLRKTYAGRVPGGADFVCYWFEKARAALVSQALTAAGFVATNSIRGGKNRAVLDAIVKSSRIFDAWSDEPWVNDGAAVRVSLVAFGEAGQPVQLNGQPSEAIHSDLTGYQSAKSAVDLTSAKTLLPNLNACFVGTSKKASFDVPGELARSWLGKPNPNGRSNAEVVKQWINGADIVRRPSDTWIVDFGVDTKESDAALFELPYEHILRIVKPEKAAVRNEAERRRWWLHARAAPDMRTALTSVSRFFATSIVAKHRVWVWFSCNVLPSHATCIVARADDTTFGILHSRFHELWSLRMCTWLGVGNDPRYTPTTCFETFPFPAGLTPADTAHQQTEALPSGARIPAGLGRRRRLRIQAKNGASPGRASAGGYRNQSKQGPRQRHCRGRAPAGCAAPELAEPARVDGEGARGGAAGPGRFALPRPHRAAPRPARGRRQGAAKRTLTNLYNQRPAWLAQAHEQLDAAVAAAYGWADYTPQMPDDEILRRLLALNLARAGSGA